jgi:hypothetical protein
VAKVGLHLNPRVSRIDGTKKRNLTLFLKIIRLGCAGKRDDATKNKAIIRKEKRKPAKIEKANKKAKQDQPQAEADESNT